MSGVIGLFFDEGEEKQMDDFVYSEIRADLSDKEKSRSSAVVFDVYPERIPRDKEDKIKTVVVVKGSRNSVFIGEVGCTTRFKAGDYEFGARVSVEEDGALNAITINLNEAKCDVSFKTIKSFKSKVRLAVIAHEDICRQAAVGDDSSDGIHTIHIPLTGVLTVHQFQDPV